nr:NHL repeat-containing protein [Novipirellula aureliae]
MKNNLNRRNWMRASVAIGTAAIGSTAIPGCISGALHGQPELVWGRRGFSEGRFLKPRAIAIDPADRLYIVDTTGRIQVFDADGNYLRGWSTPQTKNGRPTGLAVALPTGFSPSGVDGPDAQLSAHRLLVADTHYYRMLCYTLSGKLVPEQQIGGVAGYSPGEFAFVTDAVCDADGCFYIGEYGDSDRIQKFDPSGQFMTSWGGTGNQPGQFVRPQSLVVQGQTLWVADACNHRIQRFDLSTPTPTLVGIFGSQGSESGQFYYPYDLTLAADGTIVVCEYGNQRLQRIDSNGNWIASWGGPGFQNGQLYQPWGVVIDSDRRVHVLDSNNHRVQRLPLSQLS